MTGSLPPDPLLAAIAELASTLPTTVLVDLAGKIERARTPWNNIATSEVLAAVRVDAVRESIERLFAAWQHGHPELPPQTVAWSIRSAAAMDGWHRAAQSLEIVWTGPAPSGSVLRRTDQALYELVRSARSELLLVTFAAYRVQRLRDALRDARGRGVALTFVIESPFVGDGKVSVDPMVGLGQDLGAEVWVWPEARRMRDDKGRHGTLHAKCALADSASLLVSSANLTGDALGINMELGLLVEGGDAPKTIRQHFRRLMNDGVLQRTE